MQKEQINELFRAVSKSDEVSYEKLFKLYFPRLYSFALKIVRDEIYAKDIVQNVFVKIWEKPEVLRVDHPEAFIYRMVRNASLNFVRHLKIVENFREEVKDHFMGEELYHIDMVGDEPYILIREELHKQIMDVMNSLSPKCQTVFKMSRLEGLKNQEIADQLGISIKSVEKHISKALTIYRDNFSGYIPLQIVLLTLPGLV